ncbi:MAG: GNAT family N-acetyltransferase [Nocardioides sp.]
MLDDLWPLFGLCVETRRLQLRLPGEEELSRLARLAATGVHRPDERPFLTPWAEGSPQERARSVLQGQWDARGAWEPDDWRLGLGVFRDGEVLGVVTLRARDFRVVREVTTASWLGLAHQRQGVGTEAREGVLALAFDHLGVESALTEVFPDNHGSQGVSRRLGYHHDGTSRDARGEEVLVSDRLRLDRADWVARGPALVTVRGLTGALPDFGLVPA